MGQQQLLLLVLGIVIVGLAVVVGINAFGENQRKANADAMVNDAIRVASDAQAWKLKPAAFGGQADNLKSDEDNFNGVTWSDLGYPEGGNGCAGTEYGNLNGCYTITGSTTSLSITGTSSQTGNTVTVTVTGTNSDDIATNVAYGT